MTGSTRTSRQQSSRDRRDSLLRQADRATTGAGTPHRRFRATAAPASLERGQNRSDAAPRLTQRGSSHGARASARHLRRGAAAKPPPLARIPAPTRRPGDEQSQCAPRAHPVHRRTGPETGATKPTRRYIAIAAHIGRARTHGTRRDRSAHRRGAPAKPATTGSKTCSDTPTGRRIAVGAPIDRRTGPQTDATDTRYGSASHTTSSNHGPGATAQLVGAARQQQHRRGRYEYLLRHAWARWKRHGRPVLPLDPDRDDALAARAPLTLAVGLPHLVVVLTTVRSAGR